MLQLKQPRSLMPLPILICSMPERRRNAIHPWELTTRTVYMYSPRVVSEKQSEMFQS